MIVRLTTDFKLVTSRHGPLDDVLLLLDGCANSLPIRVECPLVVRDIVLTDVLLVGLVTGLPIGPLMICLVTVPFEWALKR